MEDEEVKKFCSRCKTEKPVNTFPKNSNRPDKLHNWCKSCTKTASRAWYYRDLEKHRARANESAKKHKLRRLFVQAKSRAKKNNRPFSIEITDIKESSYCPVLNLPFSNDSKGTLVRSLDRVDSTKGYVKGNVCLISLRANTLKNDGTAEEHRQIADYIEKHQADQRRADYSDLEP
jgi:hypothetical protein